MLDNTDPNSQLTWTLNFNQYGVDLCQFDKEYMEFKIGASPTKKFKAGGTYKFSGKTPDFKTSFFTKIIEVSITAGDVEELNV